MQIRGMALIGFIFSLALSGHVAHAAEACRPDSLSSLPQLVQERMPQQVSRSECGVFVQDAGYGYDIATPDANQKMLSRVRQVLAMPFVKGVSLHLNWRSFAPARASDAFDFSKYNYAPFDAGIAAAQASGKTVSLSLSVAAFAPAYVMQECPKFGFAYPLPTVVQNSAPVPWTDCYHKYFDAVVAALAKKYDGNPTVRYVSINGPSTLLGIETNWPMKKGSLIAAPAYASTFTLANYVTEWKRSIDQFVKSFPHTQLALALNDHIAISPGDAQSLQAVQGIRDYAIERYAKGTARSDKRIVIRLLGLTDANANFFKGPNDCSGRNLNSYVALAWDRRDAIKIAFEWTKIASRARDGSWTPDRFSRALFNGISWGAVEIDLKLADVFNAYRGQEVTAYTSAIAPLATAYNHCGQ